MNIKSSVIAASCALLLCAVNGHLHAQQVDSAVYDIVIERGMVIDPGTKFEGIANVGINAGKIAIVTSDKLHGRDVINARGLVVAPGFIDLHAHGQSKAADRMQAFDGVTTTLELESGILPVGDWYLQQQTNGRVLNYGTSAAWTFARIGEIEGIAPKADLLWYQKAFTLDKWVNQPASREQVAGIVAALEQGLREGAIGIGINAGYAPGGGYKELLALHALAAKYDVPTFTHISGDFPDDPRSAAESIGDIISMTVATGSHSHICHINSSSLKDIDTTLSMLAAAQADNLPITTESYTYGASSTTAGAALFTDEAREKKSINTHDIEFNGRALDDASFAELRSSEPGSVVVWHFLDLPKDEALLDKSVMFPGAAIASDAMPWTNRTTGLPVDDDAWPLADTSFAHPRSAGTYTKLLSHWVRERGLVSLSEAIRKSSLIPAQILETSVPQMRKKGRLQAGMDADIIVFDPKTVRDRASFTQPYLASTGMSYVFVNGVAVIQRGRLLLDAAPGQPIRRAPTTN